jgi:hypothetical protein
MAFHENITSGSDVVGETHRHTDGYFDESTLVFGK